MKTTLNKEQLILAMLAASRKPCPEVVPAIRMQHKITGKRHSIFGLPFGFNPDDYKSVTIGYVFQDPKSNTTYGKVKLTPEECYTAHAEWENAKADDFRKELESMSDDRFQAQANYWLKDN